MRSGVLCAGSVVVDVGKVIDAYPAQERLAIVESVALSTGGPAVNIAVDLAHLGAPFPLAVAGVVGQDEYGDFLLGALAAEGVDTSRVRRSNEAATSFTDAMVVRDGGSRTFFHHVGANDLLSVRDVDPEASSARILHMGAPGLHPTMDAAAGWVEVLGAAQAAGMHTNLELVSLAPERIRAVALSCLPHLDSIVVNEIEASALVAEPVPASGVDGPVDWAALERVAARLVELGVSALAAVHFPAGCVAAAPGGLTWRQGSVRLPQAEIRSATGAGDAFASGVVLGLHEGWAVPGCLRAGVSAAAACLRGAGTSDAVLALADCLALGERYGFRPTS